MTSIGNDKTDNDKGGYERDVARFADNSDGTTSLKEFLEQVGRCGERIAGNTGKQIYTGSQGLTDDPRCLEILRSVYGDPASGPMFYLHFLEVLKKLGWAATKNEQCLFVKKHGGCVTYN